MSRKAIELDTQNVKQSEIVAGVAMSVMCLASALSVKGVLSLREFREQLRVTYDEMDADAAGGEGFVLERLIETLNETIGEK